MVSNIDQLVTNFSVQSRVFLPLLKMNKNFFIRKLEFTIQLQRRVLMTSGKMDISLRINVFNFLWMIISECMCCIFRSAFSVGLTGVSNRTEKIGVRARAHQRFWTPSTSDAGVSCPKHTVDFIHSATLCDCICTLAHLWFCTPATTQIKHLTTTWALMNT